MKFVCAWTCDFFYNFFSFFYKSLAQPVGYAFPMRSISVETKSLHVCAADLRRDFNRAVSRARVATPDLVDNKIFYFDIGQNNRGVFMRVSEVGFFISVFLQKAVKIHKSTHIGNTVNTGCAGNL